MFTNNFVPFSLMTLFVVCFVLILGCDRDSSDESAGEPSNGEDILADMYEAQGEELKGKIRRYYDLYYSKEYGSFSEFVEEAIRMSRYLDDLYEGGKSPQEYHDSLPSLATSNLRCHLGSGRERGMAYPGAYLQHFAVKAFYSDPDVISPATREYIDFVLVVDKGELGFGGQVQEGKNTLFVTGVLDENFRGIILNFQLKDEPGDLSTKGAEVVQKAWEGDWEYVKDMISKYPSYINAKDKDGMTIMHVWRYVWPYHVYHNDSMAFVDLKNLAEFLLSRGAEINARNKYGMTPLSQINPVASSRIKPAIEFLIAKGANVNTKDNLLGCTPLHNAAKGNKEMAELLIAGGANLNARTKNGWTPLHIVAINGRDYMVELLISKGASVDAKTNDGRTPLHIAAREGHKEVVKTLVSKGADINAKERNGKTALAIAIEGGHKDVADLLRKHGAKE
ncbi:MAG: ankyrin repeat domain-containing protein [Planctomycetota bacterium]